MCPVAVTAAVEPASAVQMLLPEAPAADVISDTLDTYSIGELVALAERWERVGGAIHDRGAHTIRGYLDDCTIVAVEG